MRTRITRGSAAKGTAEKRERREHSSDSYEVPRRNFGKRYGEFEEKKSSSKNGDKPFAKRGEKPFGKEKPFGHKSEKPFGKSERPFSKGDKPFSKSSKPSMSSLSSIPARRGKTCSYFVVLQFSGST